jgi:hypothetical protein
MNIFDMLVDEALEAVRLAIYRRTNRKAPARKNRQKNAEAAAEKSGRVARRRRGPNWGGMLLWVGVIVAGVYVFRRLTSRSE